MLQGKAPSWVLPMLLGMSAIALAAWVTYPHQLQYSVPAGDHGTGEPDVKMAHHLARNFSLAC